MRYFSAVFTAVLFSVLIGVSGSYSQNCTQDSDCGISNACITYTCLNSGFCASSITGCFSNNPCSPTLGCDPVEGCQFGQLPDGETCRPLILSECFEETSVCEGGFCAPVAIDCDDMNECTADFCDDIEGCGSEIVEDGTGCNEGQGVCVQGTCEDSGCDCGDPNAITEGYKVHNKTIFFGTRDDDIICGTDEKDLIFGFAGNDCIDAGGGRDKAFGGFGHDLIFMGPGNDKVWGGPGDDEIDGGDDNDKIWGGSGYDICSGERVRSCEE